MNWLKHAFAIEDKQVAAQPSSHQSEAIDRILKEVHRRGMSLPASMALETCRPLNYVGSQLLVFFSPIMKLTLGIQAQDEFARFLEQRGSIDYLLNRLETLGQKQSAQAIDNPDASNGPDA